MNKMFSIALYSILTTSSFVSHADMVWKKVESSVQEDLHHIDFSGGHGWVVGSGGTLLRTFNAGESWDGSSKHDSSWHFVDFINPKQGWAIGAGQIFSTSDGGENWNIKNEQMFFANGNLVQFVDDKKGWVFSDGVHFLTEDGGITWQNKQTPHSIIAKGSDVQVIDDYIWTASWTGGILHSRDNGINWTIQEPDGIYYQTGVNFIDKNNGWLLGYQYGGSNSSEKQCDNYTGYVFRTTDGGDNWIKISTLCGYTGRMNFVNEKQGWLISHGEGINGSVIMSTKDGGHTWENAFQANVSLKDIYMAGENDGWAVGEEGTLLHYSSDENTDGSTAAGIAQCQMDPASCGIFASKIINISTRARVSGGENNAFAGFVIDGNVPKKVIIRGISVSEDVDPSIIVLNHFSRVEIARNDNWQESTHSAEIGSLPHHLQLPKISDAGLLLELSPGVYDVILSSVSLPGLALVSVDEVP